MVPEDSIEDFPGGMDADIGQAIRTLSGVTSEETVDEQESALLQHTPCQQAKLHQQQNYNSSIFYRLPNELIEEVFIHAVVTHDIRFKVIDYDCETREEILGVSSRFLCIGLTTPQLWAFLSVKYEISELKISIRRSRNTLLDISCRLDGEDRRVVPFLDLASQYLHRWRSFNGTVECLSQYLRMLLIQGPAPQLEMFTLTSSRYQRPKGLPAGDLFHGQAPRLMSLNVPELTLSWDLLSLPSLEHLSIADHNGENSQWALRYHRLFHSFENIRSICIDRGGGFLDLGRQATVLDIIRLPSLESLGLLNLSSAISTTILSFLSSCNIEELVISGLPFEPDVLGSLAALDRETVFPSLLSKVTHMYIRQMQLSIVTKGSIADLPNVLNPSKTFIPFAFGVHGARALTAPSLNSLLSTLFRFSSPLSLCFQGISFFRRQILATQLPLLGFIEELTLRGEKPSPGRQYDNVDDILQSLSATPILCPGLRKLTLERVNFQGQVLLDLVKFRCSPRAATNDADVNVLARLKVLTISHYPGDMDYSLIPEIQRHVEQEGKFILTWPLL